MKHYLIGIDIGTQGTKAALFDQNLKAIDIAFEPSRLLGEKTGEIWQEPDDLYGSCIRTIKELMEKTGTSPAAIAAIGVDGQMAGIMGIDKSGEASTYYDSWLDTRCSSYGALLEHEAGDEILEYSGGPATGNHAAKILWWKENYPEDYKKTKAFVLPHGYVTGKMVGNGADRAVFDHTCLHFNSFSNNVKKQWNEALLAYFNLDSRKMPRIVSPFELIGTTTEEFAHKSGLISGIPVTAGLGDSAASNFGSGMFRKGMLLDCAGTASILSSVVDTYVPDRENKTLVMMRSPIENLWMPLSYIGGGGMCIRWLRDQLSGSPPMSYEELEAEALLRPAGCNGLLFSPHFSGRAFPHAPEMKGAFLGLDFHHTRGDLYRAVLESIAMEYDSYLAIIRKLYGKQEQSGMRDESGSGQENAGSRQIREKGVQEQINAVGIRAFERLNAVGGGADSRLFNQIKADVLGIPVQTWEMGETALIGSAAVAGAAVGMLPDYQEKIQRAMTAKDCMIPKEEHHEIYREKSRRHRRMMELLTHL